jgi:hypothetical protein
MRSQVEPPVETRAEKVFPLIGQKFSALEGVVENLSSFAPSVRPIGLIPTVDVQMARSDRALARYRPLPDFPSTPSTCGGA